MTTRLLVALALLGLPCQGVVIYCSVAPGEFFMNNPGEGFVNNIDLDGDGTRDFFTSTSPNAASIIPTGSNRVLSVSALPPDLGRWISPMSGGEIIGSAPAFPTIWSGLADRVNQFDNRGAAIYFCNSRGPIGEPPDCISVIPDGNQTRFVGLEFTSNGETKYGYVSISVDVLTPLHFVNVEGWAFETTPNKPIMAGAIPEPSSALLVAAGCLMGIPRRKRRLERLRLLRISVRKSNE